MKSGLYKYNLNWHEKRFKKIKWSEQLACLEEWQQLAVISDLLRTRATVANVWMTSVYIKTSCQDAVLRYRTHAMQQSLLKEERGVFKQR